MIEFLDSMIWLGWADSFALGKCKLQGRNIWINKRAQLSGPDKWAVQMERSFYWVLGKDGHWHMEPIPSSRTDEYLDNTRFDTKEEALEAYRKFIEIGKRHTLYTDGLSEPVTP